MGRHTWKVSPQTESQEQKQCAGAKDRELTGNSTAILRMFTYQRSWLNMVVQVNIILVKMPSDR